jgi:hypothetical protein
MPVCVPAQSLRFMFSITRWRSGLAESVPSPVWDEVENTSSRQGVSPLPTISPMDSAHDRAGRAAGYRVKRFSALAQGCGCAKSAFTVTFGDNRTSGRSLCSFQWRAGRSQGATTMDSPGR